MLTGEGKTLTATLPAYLNALTGDGVHVMTANDYLARRDAEWMGPVYRFLGLRVGLLGPIQKRDTAIRRPAYQADITYGHHFEFAYDYLRDNLEWESADVVQRGLHMAIVDEADLVLIDETRSTPQIAGPGESSMPWPAEFAKIAPRLEPGKHYDADPSRLTVVPTEEGIRQAENWLDIDNLYSEATQSLVSYLRNAIKAKEFYRKNYDYLVEDGQVVLIDAATGRPRGGSRFTDGMHEALEAKEGLEIGTQDQVLARVPVWDFLRQYGLLSGMTGSAMTDQQAYRQVYELDVVTIPTNRPMIRVDHRDKIYGTAAAKLRGIVAETALRNASGQPVLIGATSIDQAESLSGLLTERGIGHEVLTAKNHEREAAIIAAAGRLGGVTVVAKMAGRGVDIVLGGGNPAEREKVLDCGGLCVLGTERTGERRLELHLRGRAGRQGDPGESRFSMSFDDQLLGSVIKGAVRSMFMKTMKDTGIEDGLTSRQIDKMQAGAAASMAAWLTQTISYDQVLADQQHLVYAERREVLVAGALRERIQAMLGEVIRAEVAAAAKRGAVTQQLWGELSRLYPLQVTPEVLAAQRGCGAGQLPPDYIAEKVTTDAREAYARRDAQVGSVAMRELEKRVTLSVIDRAWREHLQGMDDLLRAIQARSAGGLVPLPDYRREAAQLFSAMRDEVRKDIIRYLFSLSVEVADH